MGHRGPEPTTTGSARVARGMRGTGLPVPEWRPPLVPEGLDGDPFAVHVWRALCEALGPPPPCPYGAERRAAPPRLVLVAYLALRARCSGKSAELLDEAPIRGLLKAALAESGAESIDVAAVLARACDLAGVPAE